MKFEIIFCANNLDYAHVTNSINSLVDMYGISGYLTETSGFYRENDSTVREVFYKYQGSYIKKDFPNKRIWKVRVRKIAKMIKAWYNQKEVWIDFIESKTVQV